ncbi:MAG: ornithine cyclodeaminase family protein [Firmicutes bacterium]|nr:ornithine cyclodeaminase family protein [Bacillota bacterium]
MRLLSNEEVATVLDWPSVIEELRKLYQEVGSGISVSTPRTDLHHPGPPSPDGSPTAHYLKAMGGGFVGGGVAALRLSSDRVRFVSNPSGLRRVKDPVRPGRWLGLILLFDLHTGELVAVLPDGVIQRMRVGATNALADDYLARPEIETVAVFGSGDQAEAHLQALASVRSFDRVRVWSPTPEHRGRFAARMQERLERPVEAADTPEAAVAGADLLMTATNSRQGFVPVAWIRPGLHLSTLQRDELTPAAIQAVDRLVVHTQLWEVNATSAGLPWVEGRLLRDHPESASVAWEGYPTLGDLVAGRAPGRQRGEEVTAFVNNIGLGAQFAAVAGLAWRRCRELGLGRELDPEWFLQAMHP